MIRNLFSIFDPSTKIIFINLSINWISILLLLIIPNIYWIIPNSYILIYNKLIYLLNYEFKVILKKK